MQTLSQQQQPLLQPFLHHVRPELSGLLPCSAIYLTYSQRSSTLIHTLIHMHRRLEKMRCLRDTRPTTAHTAPRPHCHLAKHGHPKEPLDDILNIQRGPRSHSTRSTQPSQHSILKLVPQITIPVPIRLLHSIPRRLDME